LIHVVETSRVQRESAYHLHVMSCEVPAFM